MRRTGQNGGGTRRIRSRVVSLLICATALLGLPASAEAAISLTGSHAEPVDLSAGAHSDFKVHVKDLVISLPPGEVGNPLATPELCDPSQLPDCPDDTAVGNVQTKSGGGGSQRLRLALSRPGDEGKVSARKPRRSG
jgi:hypothetical protein